MAITQQDLIDAFCRRYSYDTFKLENETKVQFIRRKERGWSKVEAQQQIRDERRKATNEILEGELLGVEI